MKATAEEYEFHHRMLDPDDPVAFAELASWLYSDLVEEALWREGPHADAHLVEEAVGEALLDYCDAPDRYDPERSSLRGYLLMAAHGDYLNSLAKEGRRSKGHVSLSHELVAERALPEKSKSVEAVLDQIEAEALWQAVEQAFPDPVERQVVELLVEGERHHERYAEVLGIAHLPMSEQVARVKRAKDRIKKRLRRIGKKLHE